MKPLLLLTLLVAGTGLMHASIIETITFDLSGLHAGSTLSGTFSLSDSPMADDTAPVTLTFSDPSDYSPTSISATITIENGTPSGYAVDFSELTFTNLSGVTTPVDTKDVDLMRTAFAQCASFPCDASGGFEDRSPAVFSAEYTITASSVPEPASALLLALALPAIVFGRKRSLRP
jgi:hypothetical protein